MAELFAVMPIYNEASNLKAVVEEWLPVFRNTGSDFAFCLLNDGSKDDSLRIARELATIYPEIVVVDKANTGHGQTCIEGYRLALSQGAEWVFQLDSDGQCDPRYFPEFWDARSRYPLIYGYRQWRDDGCFRFLISRILSTVIFIMTGLWVGDANVPYRLMHCSTLDILTRVSPQIYLANIYVAILQHKHHGIHWRNIRFRKRAGEVASANGLKICQLGLDFMVQLKNAPLA